MKPDFLIVGAAKSGTTSLFEYLRKHPDVYMPSGKDISYFGGNEDRDREPISRDQYYDFFSSAKSGQRIGEASVSYLYSKDAPTKIAEELGTDIDIIIILRHPARMAYSLWGQNRRDGGEKLDFDEALRQEHVRMQDPDFKKHLKGFWIYNYAYLDRVKYLSQVKRYLEMFGEDRVKIYLYEEFFSDIESHLKNLFEFLNIDSSFKLDRYEKFNPAGKTKYSLLHKIYSEKMLWTTPLRILIPKPVRKTLMMKLYYWNTKTQPLPEVSASACQFILDNCMEDIEGLGEITGKPFKEIWS